VSACALAVLGAACASRPPAAPVILSPPAGEVPPALMVPVEGVLPARVPDTFNAVRGDRTHRAIDFLATRGTPVLAVADGRVYRIRETGPGGRAVYATDSTLRWMFYYAHLDTFRPGLAEGAKLVQGEVIGYVGTTGNAPANTPHLHFQLMRARFDARWWDGDALDPRPYFVKTGEPR
jgi:peptidoglycan LD-endopeptidase LytH